MDDRAFSPPGVELIQVAFQVRLRSSFYRQSVVAQARQRQFLRKRVLAGLGEDPDGERTLKESLLCRELSRYGLR